MNDIVNKTEPYICRCAECMKLGPLYANINKDSSKLEKSNNEKPVITKKQILNIGWIIIILFLLVSSKFLKYNKYI